LFEPCSAFVLARFRVKGMYSLCQNLLRSPQTAAHRTDRGQRSNRNRAPRFRDREYFRKIASTTAGKSRAPCCFCFRQPIDRSSRTLSLINKNATPGDGLRKHPLQYAVAQNEAVEECGAGMQTDENKERMAAEFVSLYE
jgi:hypothetical protein